MKSFEEHLKTTGEIGFVEEVNSVIARVNGLPNVKSQELVMFENGEQGQVMSFTKNFVEVMTFTRKPIQVGVRVTRTNELLQAPVGNEVLGHIIDPLGFSINKPGTLRAFSNFRQVNTIPLGIETRKKITRPCSTGVVLVDLAIPLGHGQRELVLGDRKTGKSMFLLQTILSQVKKGTVCIYSFIGKRNHDVKLVEEFLIANGIMDKVVLIMTTAEDPISIIYLTPYTAMTMAEYFRDQGEDVLLVFDDLTTHAKFYREMSLIGRRFPGRNSYPGDIFYTHARLLERAGNFVTEKGERAITCLPVVETLQGNLSDYIQTNLMSITDGHIYFDSDLFSRGRRPAINPFLSVTRVGHNTQTPLERTLNREIVSFLTLYEKVQSFVHFGAELSDSIKATLATGERIYKYFDQALHSVIPVAVQITLFSLLWNGAWRAKETLEMRVDTAKMVQAYETNASFQKTLDQMATSAQSFNDFLTDIAKNGEMILKTAGITPPPQPQLVQPAMQQPVQPSQNVQPEKVKK